MVLGEFRHKRARAGTSRCVDLIGEGWMIYLSGGWMCSCRFRDGCENGYGRVWADMSKGGQRGAGLNMSD